MGIFSFFGKPASKVKGSNCDIGSKSHIDYYEDDEIDEQIISAQGRRDTVIFSEEDFNESTVHQRFDDDCKQIESGPWQS